jgi:GxxExxY protein
MNADRVLFERELSDQVLRSFYRVYRELGYGFLEAVYENSLAQLLRQAGLQVLQQAPIEVRFQGALVGNAQTCSCPGA